MSLSSTNPLNTTNVWARELHDGSRSVLLLNVGTQQADVTCDLRCFIAMGLSTPSMTLHVRDLWTHRALDPITPALGFTAHGLAPAGGFQMIRVTPAN